PAPAHAERDHRHEERQHRCSAWRLATPPRRSEAEPHTEPEWHCRHEPSLGQDPEEEVVRVRLALDRRLTHPRPELVQVVDRTPAKKRTLEDHAPRFRIDS